MNIALIAHDSKKELMVQFCIAYCRILSHHDIRATGTTGKLVAEATGLHIQRYLSGSQGGDQQLASSISCNEVDLLIFFRDPSTQSLTSQTTSIFSASATYTISPLQRISLPPRLLSTPLSAETSTGENT